MEININETIEVLTGIFTVLILSSQSVQGIISSKLKNKIISNTYIKHLILIIAIYTTELYKIINFDYLKFDSEDCQYQKCRFILKNLVKT